MVAQPLSVHSVSQRSLKIRSKSFLRHGGVVTSGSPGARVVNDSVASPRCDASQAWNSWDLARAFYTLRRALSAKCHSKSTPMCRGNCFVLSGELSGMKTLWWRGVAGAQLCLVCCCCLQHIQILQAHTQHRHAHLNVTSTDMTNAGLGFLFRSSHTPRNGDF